MDRATAGRFEVGEAEAMAVGVLMGREQLSVKDARAWLDRLAHGDAERRRLLAIRVIDDHERSLG